MSNEFERLRSPRPGAVSAGISLLLAVIVAIDSAFLLGQPDNSHINGSLTTQTDELVILVVIFVVALVVAWWMWKKATPQSLTWMIVAMILAGPVFSLIAWAIPALGPVGFFLIVGGAMLCALGMLFALAEGIAWVIRRAKTS